MQVMSSTASAASPLDPARRDAQMRDVALRLEAQFLSEMLRHAGLGESGSAFSGGVGEEQFGSFLREQQARQIAQAGGVGLAESIFQSLKART